MATADIGLTLKDLPPLVVKAIFDLLEDAILPGPPIGGVVLFTTTKGAHMGEIRVKDTEENLVAKIVALDSEGHATTFDETPTWETSDDSVAAVTPSDDGYAATFVVGAPGAAAITVTGVESSDGERKEIVFTGLVTVDPGDAVSGSIEFSIATPEPTPAPSDTTDTEPAPADTAAEATPSEPSA